MATPAKETKHHQRFAKAWVHNWFKKNKQQKAHAIYVFALSIAPRDVWPAC